MNTSSESIKPTDCDVEYAPTNFSALYAPRGVYMMLNQFGVIDVHGSDAVSFLHRQLTNNIQTLEADNVRLAGFCSLKGRLLATFLVWRVGNIVRMLVSEDLVELIQKRLSMFILREKVQLINATNSLAVVGFSGDVCATLSQCFEILPNGVNVKIDTPFGELIRVIDANRLPRFLWVGPRSAIEERLTALNTTHQVQQADSVLWDWLDIRAGIPRVSAVTSNRFVPQMINFELIGGVNFHKGCYPGQEVVARSQYRGTIKRRTVLAHSTHAHIGAEVFHSENPIYPCGIVVNSATAAEGGVDCLVQLKLDTLDTGSIHVGSPRGPMLEFSIINTPVSAQRLK
ncbi:CAF17-like 4Fe-4S cluster assembly/insertion protein YgfZ [Candidatus Vallotiella sp. (ex Adelges kitamiensis)]|uniref:CAF17-like 4Fe-4S cluster assembly/insertion protein YgfZ n=1 Tax=Candidatus Vallotiella sp. (ex Adelges kitamiensis) TaxID=2864217 RepID=UPI001CE2329A|nr:folate-binding protein [Candidatus Vallotia sp. (ex Adelges kitamiensis)]